MYLLISSYIPFFSVVLGVSAAKSIFMRAIIENRTNKMHTTGDIKFEQQNKVASGQRDAVYIDFHNNITIGYVSVREYLKYVNSVTCGATNDYNNRIIDIRLETFNLVSDVLIQPLFGKSLNTYQRIKVAICAELLNPPSILLLDGPLDELDSSLSYKLLTEIQQAFLELSVKFSIVLSMKQSSPRLLELCNRIFVFGQESMVYFGPPLSLP